MGVFLQPCLKINNGSGFSKSQMTGLKRLFVNALITVYPQQFTVNTR